MSLGAPSVAMPSLAWMMVPCETRVTLIEEYELEPYDQQEHQGATITRWVTPIDGAVVLIDRHSPEEEWLSSCTHYANVLVGSWRLHD